MNSTPPLVAIERRTNRFPGKGRKCESCGSLTVRRNDQDAWECGTCGYEPTYTSPDKHRSDCPSCGEHSLIQSTRYKIGPVYACDSCGYEAVRERSYERRPRLERYDCLMTTAKPKPVRKANPTLCGRCGCLGVFRETITNRDGFTQLLDICKRCGWEG